MIDLIESLFDSSEFISKKIEDCRLYSYKETSEKAAFWLVANVKDLAPLLRRQDKLFDACKKIGQHHALDKNISMLVLWETGGDQKINNMKRRIMSAEEDPYYFKKNILYYSSSELKLLKDKVGDTHIYDFLKKEVISTETFAEYKQNPTDQTWQSLLYRIVIKLPFIKIEIEEEAGGLNSLFALNASELNARGLADFDKSLSKTLDSVADSSKMKPEDWLKRLTPALEGTENGD